MNTTFRAGWIESDLSRLPSAEDDYHEYKSSLTLPDSLKTDLHRAASAFWNSGGGILVAGVDDAGRPDGGIDPAVRRKPLREWVDQALHRVEPVGGYAIHVIEPSEGNPYGIATGKVILVVEFSESHILPHMAPDNKYYIRAGAHSVPAGHFIVESLRTRRGLTQPVLRAVMRLKPGDSHAVQLGLVTLTDAPAVDVGLTLEPLPHVWRNVQNHFPMRIGVIDRANPFYFDLSPFTLAHEHIGEDVHFRAWYQDVAGRSFTFEQRLDVYRMLSPWKIGKPADEKLAHEVEGIRELLEGMLRR